MKKLLFAFLGLILFAVVAFFAIGLAVPTVEYQNSVDIARPPERVWDLLMDETKADQWLDGLKRIENLEGEHCEVGSRWRLVFEENGEEMAVLEEVTTCDPPRTFAFDVDTAPFIGATRIELEPSDTGTRLTSTSSMSGKNLAWRALLFLSKGMIEARGQQSYDKLEMLAEAS